MDLDFYVRICTCKKRVTGEQPYAWATLIKNLTLLQLVSTPDT